VNTPDHSIPAVINNLGKKGQPKTKKSKEDSAKKPNKMPRKKATFAPEDSEGKE